MLNTIPKNQFSQKYKRQNPHQIKLDPPEETRNMCANKKCANKMWCSKNKWRMWIFSERIESSMMPMMPGQPPDVPQYRNTQICNILPRYHTIVSVSPDSSYTASVSFNVFSRTTFYSVLLTVHFTTPSLLPSSSNGFSDRNEICGFVGICWLFKTPASSLFFFFSFYGKFSLK